MLPNLAPQIRTAFLQHGFKHRLKVAGRSEFMTLRTSEAAESCSNASSRSRAVALLLLNCLIPLTFEQCNLRAAVIAAKGCDAP